MAMVRLVNVTLAITANYTKQSFESTATDMTMEGAILDRRRRLAAQVLLSTA